MFSVATTTREDRLPWANDIGVLDSMERKRIPNTAWPKALYADGHMLFPRETTLMAQPFDLQKGETAGEAFPVAEQIQTLVNFGVGIFSVSTTGVLAYQTGINAAANQLVWVDRTGKNTAPVADQAAYSDVQLSPDGKRASTSVVDPAQRNRDVWIVDLTRGLRTRFTFDPSDELASVWSADSTRVVFNSRRKGRLDLYQKASSGAGEEELVYADNRDKFPVSWSRDGKFLLYTSLTGANLADLWVLPLSGERKPIPFVNSRFDEGPGEFSPDGRWIVYRSNESGRFEVYVAPFPGPGGKWQVSTNGGTAPRWSADGKEIFYTVDNRIMAAAVAPQATNFEVGAVRPLFSVTPGGPGNFYAVSRDAQRFLVNTQNASTSSVIPPITVAVNWLGAARR
jgi:dipeptidyl aminopeptidase/acylaminoacyl peptidase